MKNWYCKLQLLHRSPEERSELCLSLSIPQRYDIAKNRNDVLYLRMTYSDLLSFRMYLLLLRMHLIWFDIQSTFIRNAIYFCSRYNLLSLGVKSLLFKAQSLPFGAFFIPIRGRLIYWYSCYYEFFFVHLRYNKLIISKIWKQKKRPSQRIHSSYARI